jgi:hypothetical protein
MPGRVLAMAWVITWGRAASRIWVSRLPTAEVLKGITPLNQMPVFRGAETDDWAPTDPARKILVDRHDLAEACPAGAALKVIAAVSAPVADELVLGIACRRMPVLSGLVTVALALGRAANRVEVVSQPSAFARLRGHAAS